MASVITIVVFDQFGFLDVVGPADVFEHANQLSGSRLYETQIAAGAVGKRRRAEVVAESGLRLGVDLVLSEVAQTHTLLVVGGFGVHDVPDSTVREVERLGRTADRTGSVCTGAFALARAGLLDGRRATTHWAYAAELADQFPSIEVVGDELFVHDGSVTTAAGVAAGIDLALDLVRLDHGPELARVVSQRMVLYLDRSGGQSQFSERLTPTREVAHSEALRDLMDAVLVDPTLDHSARSMAARAGFSERHLARLFRDQIGSTPARWVERVRVDQARVLIERGAGSLESVAGAAGFSSSDQMRHAFHRVLRLTPSAYAAHHTQRARPD